MDVRMFCVSVCIACVLIVFDAGQTAKIKHGHNVLIWHYSQNTHLIFYGLWHVSDVLNASQHGSCGRGKKVCIR